MPEMTYAEYSILQAQNKRIAELEARELGWHQSLLAMEKEIKRLKTMNQELVLETWKELERAMIGDE